MTFKPRKQKEYRIKFKKIKKSCLTCGKKLKLNNNRDIKRKKFCSRRCTVLFTIKIHNIRPPKPTKESFRKGGFTRRGKNHPQWIKDRSKLKKKRFDCSDRENICTWRSDVFFKFEYTCQKCGQKGGYLIAHHIKNWADNLDLRYEVDNGIILCKDCHNKFHKKYGRRNTNQIQLNEFLNNNGIPTP